MRAGFGQIIPEEQDSERHFTVAVCRNCHLGIIVPDSEINHTGNGLTWLDENGHCCKSPSYSYLSLTTDLKERGLNSQAKEEASK